MRLHNRVDALSRRLPPKRAVPDEDAAGQRMCEMLEEYAPIPAGEEYINVDERLDAALDRLHVAGVGIPAGPNTSRMERFAAVYGMSLREFNDVLREKAGQ